jgi:hypothetical protein
MARGGKREGAGRHPTDKKRLVIHVTDQEREAIKVLIDGMRNNENLDSGKQ